MSLYIWVQIKSRNSTLESDLHRATLAEDLSCSLHVTQPAVRHSGIFCTLYFCSFSTVSYEAHRQKTTPIFLLWSDQLHNASTCIRVPQSLFISCSCIKGGTSIVRSPLDQGLLHYLAMHHTEPCEFSLKALCETSRVAIASCGRNSQIQK